jgi:asparagine synthase (glutamine-hydrolysing)
MSTAPDAATATLGRTAEFVRGRHRFTDPELATIASRAGAASAWRTGFERHGVTVLDKVEGDFAVSIVARDGTLFAAVDRFALHPLCWRERGGSVEVAERADALADASSGIDDGLDSQALFDYLYYHVIPAPRTIFRGVSRLPAGHCLVARGGAPKVERWWQPRFVEDAPAAFDTLRERFRALLDDCVCARLDASPVGCFLSGGTDSSTVAGIVTALSGAPARTYSIGFAAKGYDEMEYARLAARHFGTDHHEYYVTPEDVAQAIPALAASYDQPFGNSSVLPAYCCAKLARDDGIATMLAGDGGDELFGGNTRYAGQRVFEAWAGVPEALRKGVLEPALLGPAALKHVPLVKKAVSYVEQATTPMPDRMQRHNLLMRLGLDTVLEPQFLTSVDIDAPLARQREVYAQSNAAALVNRMLAYDWRFTLAENDLPKVVGATAHAGMPVAFPLLDDRLVDFSLALPAEYKLRGSQLRWFFKEALRGFLPDEIIAKKKHGFGLPFGVWVTQNGKLRELAFDAVRSFARRGVVRAGFVERLTDELLPQHPGYYGEMVWILMAAEVWLRAHRTSTHATSNPSARQ